MEIAVIINFHYRRPRREIELGTFQYKDQYPYRSATDSFQMFVRGLLTNLKKAPETQFILPISGIRGRVETSNWLKQEIGKQRTLTFHRKSKPRIGVLYPLFRRLQNLLVEQFVRKLLKTQYLVLRSKITFERIQRFYKTVVGV